MEHHFMYLLAIWIFSLENICSVPLPTFNQITGGVLLVFSYEVDLYNLDIDPLLII